MRATSRWLVKRTLPIFENRMRYLTGRTSSEEHQLAGALGAAGRWGGRGNDVLDAVASACAAVVARRPPAIGEADLGEGVAPVLPQEVLVQPGGQVVPRQHLVLGAMAVGVPVDRQAVLFHRVLPQADVEVLRPLLEHTAAPPHRLDHRAEPAVAARRDALDEGRLRVVPLELHPAVALERVAQQPDLAGELGDGVLPEPLERG